MKRVVLLILALSTDLQARQPAPVVPGAERDTNLSSLSFDRVLETFLWTGRLRYGGAVGGAAVDLDQSLRSRVIKTGQLSIHDEFGLRFNVALPVTRQVGLRSSAVSTIVSDNRQIDLGNLSQHQVLAGPSIRLLPSVSASLLGGFEMASQEGTRDQGFAALFEVRTDPRKIDEFDVTGMGRFGRSWLDPRKLEADSVSLSVSRLYGRVALNRIFLTYTRLGREFYTKADPGVERDYQIGSNIFRRTAQEYGVSDTLTYETRNSLFSAYAGLASRTIDRSYRYKSFSDPSNAILDVGIKDSRLFAGVSARTQLLQWLQGGVSAEFEEREERHSVTEDPSVPRQAYDRQNQAARKLTNVARRTTVGAGFRVVAGEKDFLNLSGSASILQYDTPDSLNTDDRDELLILMAVEGVHRFDETLTASVLADAALGHLVYLSRFQSANNTWNRIIRLRPRVTYMPEPWLLSVNTAEVLANYTVYDFEEQIQSVRSYSFRQASWTDSTSVRIGNSVGLLFYGSVRIYERGVLQWEDFRERPESFFVEESYWPQVHVGVTDHLSMGIGYRYFSQTRFRYEGRDRRFDRSLVNAGPTVTLAWYGVQGGRVFLEGWRETQTNTTGSSRSFSNLSIVVGMTI